MHIWAIANQKGGVGKTTTTVSLGRLLALRGYRVLLIDLDPHSSLTRAMGVPDSPAPKGVLELFSATPCPLSEIIRKSPLPRLDFIAAQPALATLERKSATQPGLGMALSQALASHTDHDVVLLDCPPTLGLLMVNALAAANRVVIPTQTEPLALHGLSGMTRTSQMIAQSRRQPLAISVIPTLFDRRTRTGIETFQFIQKEYSAFAWPEAVPLDTRISQTEWLLTSDISESQLGRALPAYQRALDWLLALEPMALPEITAEISTEIPTETLRANTETASPPANTSIVELELA